MLSSGKIYVNYTGSYIYPECGITTDEAYGGGNTAPTAYFIKLLNTDPDNTTYPGRRGFLDIATDRVWVVDYYSDWSGLASLIGVTVMNMGVRSYKSGSWAENCYYDLRMHGNPFMHEVGHTGGGYHGHGVGSSAPFHHFIANHRAGERDGCGTFSYMASGGYPFVTSAQSASHYYNSWETVLPRWRRVLKYWDNGIIPEATLLGKERRLPHGGGEKDIGLHYFRIMDVEHQYSYKFLGADEDAYKNVSFANYSLNPVFSTLVRNDQQIWVGFNDGYDPEDIIMGLKRKHHLLMVEIYLDKKGFYSGMNSDFLSVLIEHRSNTRMGWNSHSIHFQSLRPHAFQSDIVVNILNACVEKNLKGIEFAEQGAGNPIPGRLWTCPDCDLGTFQLMVIDGNYANVDPNNFSMFNEPRNENVMDMPFRNIVINYTPNSRPNPTPTPRFYPIRFMQSPGAHCYIKDGNIASDPGKVVNITCEVLQKVINDGVQMIANYYVNDPLNGLMRYYIGRLGYLSTYKTLSRVWYIREVNHEVDKNNNAVNRMTKVGGLTSTDGIFLYGGIMENNTGVLGQLSEFEYMDEFYDSVITATIRSTPDTEYVLYNRSPANFTNRVGWSMRDDRRRRMSETTNHGYIVMYDPVWNPTSFYIEDTYPDGYFGSNTNAEMYYLTFMYQYTNGVCGYSQYYYSFDGQTNMAGNRTRARTTEILMNPKDRVLMFNASYDHQNFTMVPDGYTRQGTGCWAHQNRPTLYRGNQWHMIYNPSPSHKWLLVFDFDSEIPDNLLLFTDSYNSTDVIDMRVVSAVNKASNSGSANNRTIYWSYVVGNYEVLHEFYYGYERNGGNPGIRFAFNKDVRLMNIRFLTDSFGTYGGDWRGNGGINNCGKFVKPSFKPIENRTDNPIDKNYLIPYDIVLNGKTYNFADKNTRFDNVSFPIPLKKGKFATPTKIEFYDPARPKCAAGTYVWRKQTGVYECLTCPRGYSCSEGLINLCPAGYYNDVEGQSECKIYSKAAEGLEFNKIPATLYYKNLNYTKFPLRNPDGSVIGFYECPGNMFKVNGKCQKCPPTGYICVPGMDTVPCPKGFRCGGGIAQPCFGNEYQDQEGQERCKTYTSANNKLTCSNNEFDVPLDGSHKLFRTNPVYAQLIVYLMDSPNAGCRPCPAGFKCSASEIKQCAYNEYSPEGQTTCTTCPSGQIRNAESTGCISTDPADEMTKVIDEGVFRFYGFYPTYEPPADGRPIYPPANRPTNRIHLHDLHRVTHAIDNVATVAEARAAVSNKASWTLVGAILGIGSLAVLGLVGLCLRAVLKSR